MLNINLLHALKKINELSTLTQPYFLKWTLIKITIWRKASKIKGKSKLRISSEPPQTTRPPLNFGHLHRWKNYWIIFIVFLNVSGHSKQTHFLLQKPVNTVGILDPLWPPPPNFGRELKFTVILYKGLEGDSETEIHTLISA